MWGVLPDRTKSDSFATFVQEVELRLRQALTAALGPELGREAAAEALVYGWEHWDRISEMANAAGYLYRVGRSRGGRMKTRTPAPLPPVAAERLPWIEPGVARSDTAVVRPAADRGAVAACLRVVDERGRRVAGGFQGHGAEPLRSCFAAIATPVGGGQMSIDVKTQVSGYGEQLLRGPGTHQCGRGDLAASKPVSRLGSPRWSLSRHSGGGVHLRWQVQRLWLSFLSA